MGITQMAQLCSLGISLIVSITSVRGRSWKNSLPKGAFALRKSWMRRSDSLVQDVPKSSYESNMTHLTVASSSPELGFLRFLLNSVRMKQIVVWEAAEQKK